MITRMFLGHLGAALAAKRAAPRTSLGTLVAAGISLDLVWPFFVLGGAETLRIRSGENPFTRIEFEWYPYTHGLVAVLGWAALAGVAYLAATRYRRGAMVVALLVLSHWALDLVSHVPDLPLFAGEPRVGLGLWRSVPATVAVELALLLGGVVSYARTARPSGAGRRAAFGALVGLLLAVFMANVLGPPPPDARTVALSGLLQWLFVPWAAWIDRRGAATGIAAPA